MSNEELEAYIKTIEPNFNNHLEKGTIEMSNEYYNLLEERMARLINQNQALEEKQNYDLKWALKYDELYKENQELKKQLEKKYSKPGTFTTELLYEENTKLINQQKEFIEYLENEMKLWTEALNEEHDYWLVQEFAFKCNIYEEILSKYKEIINPSKKCPNPDGKERICYQFDRFGDRAGCLGCELYTKEMFDKDDPLPGLTEKLNKEITGQQSGQV